MVYDNVSLVFEDATTTSPSKMVMLVMSGLSPEVASHVTVRLSPTLTTVTRGLGKSTVGPAGEIRKGGREGGREGGR